MGIIEAIKNAFRFIVGLVTVIIRGVLNFFKDIVKWFKGLPLNREKDTPFVADGKTFKDMLKKAPKKDYGIFSGVYNEDEDEITQNKYLEADEVDAETRSTLKDEPLVVLQ